MSTIEGGAVKGRRPTTLVWLTFGAIAIFATAFAWSGLSLREILAVLQR
jgi:hypothetical protein